MEEAPQDGVGIHAALDELDGDPTAEHLVGPFAKIRNAHSAAADFLDELIGTDPAADKRSGGPVHFRQYRMQPGSADDRCFIQVGSLGHRREERQDLEAERFVRATARLDERGPFGLGEIERLRCNALHYLPSFAGHGTATIRVNSWKGGSGHVAAVTT